MKLNIVLTTTSNFKKASANPKSNDYEGWLQPKLSLEFYYAIWQNDF